MEENTILDRPAEPEQEKRAAGLPPHLVFMGASIVLVILYFGFDQFGVRQPGLHGANAYALLQFTRLYAIFCLFFSVSYRMFKRRKLMQPLTWAHIALTLAAYGASIALWYWRPPYSGAAFESAAIFFDESFFTRLTNQMFIYPELSYLTALYLAGLGCWVVNLAVGIVRSVRGER